MKTKLLLSILLFSTLQLAAQKNSTWHIVADDIDPNNYYGITVANGMIGVVSSPEPLQVKDIVLNGVYDTYNRGRVSNILKGFSFANMYLDVGGQRITAQNIQNFTQTLDMKRAVLVTTFDVGKKASVRHEMMALRHLPYSTFIRMEITAKQDIDIQASSVIESPSHLRNVKNFYTEIDRPHVVIPLLTSVAESPTGKHTVAASNSFLFEDEKHIPNIIHEDWDYGRHWMKFNQFIKRGKTFEFGVVGSSCSTAHYDDPHNEAERLTIFAALERAERLQQRHEAAWARLWESDIVIEGADEEQRAVRSMLYHLYSFVRKGTAYSLSPMGLSGLGYNGHVFWDTEIWMYPPLLMLQPEMAKSVLEYRFQRMDAARQNAFAHGYEGVMFPWESADSGDEDTPVWALTGPFQHHITADVGWAFWKYYQVTKNKEWLKNRGYPMLKEVAEFWTSRVERNGEGQYDIKNVIGANEYEENIDNNAYTNGMAKTVLEYAALAAETLGIEPDPDWRHVADNIPILKFADGTTRENATYDGAIIKQADVNLLAYPMKIVEGEENIRKDLKYYEPRMAAEGPAMAHAILGVLYARLGDADKAHELFIRSYQPNENAPFGVLAETAGGTNPYFATGAGGALQVVLSGFGGLDIGANGIEEAEQVLPPKWKSLEIKLKNRGEK